MAEIIDGKLVSSKVREDLKMQVQKLIDNHGVVPGLAVILVGDNPASAVYVRNKHKGCVEAGMASFEIKMPEETTEKELLNKAEGVVSKS